MKSINFGSFTALEINNSYFIDSAFHSESKNESFPIFICVEKDGSFVFHDNGFIKKDYGELELDLAGIDLMAKAFGCNFDGEKVSIKAASKSEKIMAYGNLLSICYCLESSFKEKFYE